MYKKIGKMLSLMIQAGYESSDHAEKEYITCNDKRSTQLS